ncbi:MAG: hypothetical protein ABSC35_07895, partial [Candidatus Dormibacteria bacterium]
MQKMIVTIVIGAVIAALGLAACGSTVAPTVSPTLAPTVVTTVAPTPSTTPISTPTATPSSTPAPITPIVTVTACDPVGTAGGAAIAWSGAGNVYYQLTVYPPTGTPIIVYVNVNPSGTYGPLTQLGTWHYTFQADNQVSVSGTF